MTYRRTGAFTLIELLVVVAIIAVLISILMPSLASAKRNSQTVACLSNLRQLGMATQVYTSEYDNVLPGWSWNFAPVGKPNADWTNQLSGYLNVQPEWIGWGDPGQNRPVKVYMCPGAVSPFAGADQFWVDRRPTTYAITFFASSEVSMNHSYLNYTWAKRSMFEDVSLVMYADAYPVGLVTPGGTGSFFFVNGNDTATVAYRHGAGDAFVGPSRQTNAAFLDGHAVTLKASEFVPTNLSQANAENLNSPGLHTSY